MRTLIASLLGCTTRPADAPTGELVLLTWEQMGEVAGGITTATAFFSNVVTGTKSANGTATVAVSTQTSGGASTGSIHIGLTGTATG
jgi:hypothetical protein